MELRMMIIEEMEPDDRCRFTRCSKVCDKEAKASKNYIYGLVIDVYSGNINIEVHYKKYIPNAPDNLGFTLVFNKGQQLLRYNDLSFRKKWETDLDASEDVFQLAIDEFKSRLQTYQKGIKFLKIDGLFSNNLNCDIDRFNNLESLDIIGDYDYRRILSKLKRPLKKINIESDDCSEILNFKQIYQVETAFILGNTEIDSEQFSRISATIFAINIGKLTEEDIFNFVRSWQNGTIGREIKLYRWYLRGSNFSHQKLFDLLRISENREVKIRHFKEPGRSASLYFGVERLVFYTNDNL